MFKGVSVAMLKSAISIPDPAFFRNQNLLLPLPAGAPVKQESPSLPPQRGRDKKRHEDEQ
ncbi:MAG: hypothetical protein A2V87_01465 [Deltaproteobacteria bacterium RBG_16_58_17]|nr:MAG: hypothetical protein A2V87_01465 [Deltaproteobacteria bacterium RBG_16_58_17]